ncbi:heavy-metal-associated domain-containing protein [Kitasatospora sp. NPDC004289]
MNTTADPPARAVPVHTVLEVNGMDCGRCERDAKAVLRSVEGVTKVTTDFTAGRITVSSVGPPDRDALSAALAPTGLTLRRTTPGPR